MNYSIAAESPLTRMAEQFRCDQRGWDRGAIDAHTRSSKNRVPRARAAQSPGRRKKRKDLRGNRACPRGGLPSSKRENADFSDLFEASGRVLVQQARDES